jgi:hypothetical protein
MQVIGLSAQVCPKNAQDLQPYDDNNSINFHALLEKESQ